MFVVSFLKRFKRRGQNYLGTVVQGKEDFIVLDAIVRDTPSDVTILFDIRGFDLFGYSYSKQTVRRMLDRARIGEYGQRYFVIQAQDVDQAEELSSALEQKKMAMICSSSGDPKRYYEKHFVLGALDGVHLQTLEYVIKKRELTSGQLHKDLGLETIQAASNRISKLAKERLVRWEESPDRRRNVLQCKRIEL